jgi:hypothetical protein
MARYVKIASQLPEEVHRRYADLDHGQKQLACAAGFLLYFEADSEKQWIYREWAKAIAEGRADMSKPPPSLAKLMPKKRG